MENCAQSKSALTLYVIRYLKLEISDGQREPDGCPVRFSKRPCAEGPRGSAAAVGMGVLVFAGALKIQDRVAGDASPFAGQFGAELARRAGLNI